MHLSMVCPTTPTWGKYGDNVGDMQNQAHPRGGALSFDSAVSAIWLRLVQYEFAVSAIWHIFYLATT